MEPCQHLLHLYRIKAPLEGRHLAFALQNNPADLIIGGRGPAGQGLVCKDVVEIRRKLLQAKIILFVAVGAATVIKLPTCNLILGHRWVCLATQEKQGDQKQTEKNRH